MKIYNDKITISQKRKPKTTFGTSNPLFSGSLGVYQGMSIYENTYMYENTFCPNFNSKELKNWWTWRGTILKNKIARQHTKHTLGNWFANEIDKRIFDLIEEGGDKYNGLTQKLILKRGDK